MSDVKKPNAGEWWVRNDDGAIVYICGCDPDGDPVFMDDDEELHNGMLRFFTQEYHHEPRCTGFDWFEPLEPWKTIDVDPGDGYRWLDAEEFVEATDEVFRPDLNPMWVKPLTRTGYMCYHDNYPVRRKIEQPEALARVQHPTMDCPDCGEFRGHGHVCRPASLDPDDVPLNPVPGKVVATGTVTLNPVESPDDWVEYDPAHITCPRVSVDWLTPRLGESQWGPALLVWSDATWAAQRENWKIRCRRCDLPMRPDDTAAIIAEHTQQVRELTQRIGDLVQQVNERDAVIKRIRTALGADYFV